MCVDSGGAILVQRVAMSGSIRDYFHVKGGLPDPRGSLTSQLPSQAIALANKEVERVISCVAILCIAMAVAPLFAIALKAVQSWHQS